MDRAGGRRNLRQDAARWLFSPLPVAHPRQPIRGGTLASGMLARPRQVTRKFIPLALREIHAVVNIERGEAHSVRAQKIAE